MPQERLQLTEKNEPPIFTTWEPNLVLIRHAREDTDPFHELTFTLFPQPPQERKLHPHQVAYTINGHPYRLKAFFRRYHELTSIAQAEATGDSRVDIPPEDQVIIAEYKAAQQQMLPDSPNYSG